MSENVKLIVTEVNKLLGRNYNLIGFNTLNAEDLLQVSLRYFIIVALLQNIPLFLADIMQCSDEDTTARQFRRRH